MQGQEQLRKAKRAQLTAVLKTYWQSLAKLKSYHLLELHVICFPGISKQKLPFTYNSCRFVMIDRRSKASPINDIPWPKWPEIVHS